MDRVFKRRKRFFFSLLSVVFLCTANRPDENKLIQFFELSQKGRLYTGQRVHKIKVFIAEVIYSARNGLLMAFFIPWVLHIMTYMGRLRAKGVPLLCFRYTKEQRFHQLKYMKEQENASFRSVKRPKRTTQDHVVYLSQRENLLCIARSHIFFHFFSSRKFDRETFFCR